MTFDEVDTRFDQPMEHDSHRGIDQALYSLTALLYDIKSSLN